MGAPPQQSYRGRESFSPTKRYGHSDNENATARYFSATEMKVHERGWSRDKSIPPWDHRPHKSVPYTLRGQKITSNESWIEDVKQDPETIYATSSLCRLDDGQYDDNALAFRRRRDEDSVIATERGMPTWYTQTSPLHKRSEHDLWKLHKRENP